MNILYFHRTQAKGVEGVHIKEIVRAFKRLGHKVDIVSPVGDRLEDEASPAKAAEAPGWRERFYRTLSRYLPELIFELAELLYNFQALRQARRTLDSSKVDMIFERYAIFGVAGAYLSKKWNKPLIIEVNYTSCSALVRHRSALLKPLARRLDQRIFDRALGLVAVSSRLKQHLTEVYGIPPEKIIVLPNAADPDVFDISRVARKPLPFADGKIIGFVGGFYPWHGLDLLLSAFQSVAQKVGDARLLLVGDGPMMAEIRQRVDQSGLGDRVVLTGKVPHQDLPGYIANFYVGVMPDSNDYGSPMKIFEYMSMGKPVVVPDYPPLLDVVNDNEEGRVFPARNVQEMAACLEMLLTDTMAYQRMAEQARRKIVTKHNWLDNGRAILSLCEQRR
jgi:glycosyltransferase involved in cell wall biosynthesis